MRARPLCDQAVRPKNAEESEEWRQCAAGLASYRAGQFAKAIELYKHLIEHDKSNPKIAEYYDAVMEVRRKLAASGERILGRLNVPSISRQVAGQ